MNGSVKRELLDATCFYLMLLVSHALVSWLSNLYISWKQQVRQMTDIYRIAVCWLIEGFHFETKLPETKSVPGNGGLSISSTRARCPVCPVFQFSGDLNIDRFSIYFEVI